jgi:hypothetical protein
MSQQFMATGYPPNSLDLAPSDFYLFCYVKGLCRGESCEIGEQLVSAAEGIAGSLEKWTLTKVFLAGMTRLERCVETGGDYAG